MKSTSVLLLMCLLLSLSVMGDIVHRYSFDTDASDSVGTADGTLMNGALVSGNAVLLDGDDDYVDLPGNLITGFTSVTFEGWFTHSANGVWNRLFDFGDTNAGSGMGRWYIMFCPMSGPGDSRFVISDADPGYTSEEGYAIAPVPYDVPVYVACVYDGDDGSMSLYVNGAIAGSTPVTIPLSSVQNVYSYLGKALYPDPYLMGSIDEFRIHNTALGAPGVLLSAQLGPDTAQNCVLLSMTPDNGDEAVQNVPAVPFAWTVDAGASVDHYEVFLSTDPNVIDPNSADVSALIGSPTDTSWNESGLPDSTDYFWRVDTIEAGTMTRLVGPMYSFTTSPPGPFVVEHPEDITGAEGSTVSFTAEIQSEATLTVTWYKVGESEDTEVTDADPNVTITTTVDGDVTTSVLEIANLEVEDGGQYYANGTDVNGTVNSEPATLTVLRMIAHYTFEDSDPNDVTGYAPQVSAVGAVAYDTGKVGDTALSLNGTDAYIDLGDGFADFSTGLTFNVWVNSADTMWGRFISLGNGPGADNIFFSRLGMDNAIVLGLPGWTTGGMFTAGEWTMYTATMNENGIVNLYQNGIPVVENASASVPSVIERTECYIGKSNWPDPLFSGLIDDLRVYNYAISATDVADLYSAVEGNFCLNKPLYDFSENCIVDLADFVIFAGTWLDCGFYPAGCD